MRLVPLANATRIRYSDDAEFWWPGIVELCKAMKVLFSRTLLFCSMIAMVFMAETNRCIAEDVSRKLAELEKQREQIASLQMTSKTTSRMGSGNREMNIETWEKLVDGKHKLRRVVTSKATASKDEEPVESVMLMVSDGNTSWREMPQTGTKRMVFTGKTNYRGDYFDIKKMMERGEARFRGQETVLDQPCVLLEIKGKEGGDQFLATYWISERYGLILKSVSEGADQSVTETRVTEFKTEVSIEDALFVYHPPADAEIIDSGKPGKIGRH